MIDILRLKGRRVGVVDDSDWLQVGPSLRGRCRQSVGPRSARQEQLVRRCANHSAYSAEPLTAHATEQTFDEYAEIGFGCRLASVAMPEIETAGGKDVHLLRGLAWFQVATAFHKADGQQRGPDGDPNRMQIRTVDWVGDEIRKRGARKFADPR